ncbi:LysR family transcriptional regulator [Enterococcus faecalis]|uniref:LysR family transcriptional regulator n=1 Tax=Enterococcus faecalis TaxID=1351 RepID=UPI004041BB3A
MLNFNILRSFKYTVELASFKLAAEKLSYGESTISKHINELEKTLGGSMFVNRSTKNGLTKLGEVTYNYATKTLLEYERFKENVISLSNGQTTIKIGGLERYLAEEVIGRVVNYQIDHTNVNFELIHATSDETLKMLGSGNIDIEIVVDRIVPSGFTNILLKSECLVLIASYKTHKLISKNPSLVNRLPLLIDSKASVIFESVLKHNNEFLKVIQVEGDSMVLAGVTEESCIGVVSDGCFEKKEFQILKVYNNLAPVRLIYHENYERYEKKHFIEYLTRMIGKTNKDFDYHE